MACFRRRPAAGLIFHSDRGSQYCSQDFQDTLGARGIRSSMSRKGNWWDKCSHREPVGTVEDAALRARPAVCHSHAGKAGRHGLDRLLQPLAATFSTGLPQSDAVRTTLAGGAAQICRLMIGLRTPVFRGNLTQDKIWIALVARHERAHLHPPEDSRSFRTLRGPVTSQVQIISRSAASYATEVSRSAFVPTANPVGPRACCQVTFGAFWKAAKVNTPSADQVRSATHRMHECLCIIDDEPPRRSRISATPRNAPRMASLPTKLTQACVQVAEEILLWSLAWERRKPARGSPPHLGRRRKRRPSPPSPACPP